MKNLEIALALILLSSALFIAVEPTQKNSYRVNNVETVDGDTINVKGDINTTVRLVGVDTPEVTGENNPREFNLVESESSKECLRKWGETASGFTHNFTQGENVRLITDPSAGTRGDYGRLLAYVETDSSQLGRKLLEKGYARVYEGEFKQLEMYKKIQETAKREDRGLWSCN